MRTSKPDCAAGTPHPEERTRLVTDALADLLFTYSDDADANLRAENVPSECIFQVGNVMIDTLFRFRQKAEQSNVLEEIGVRPKEYVLTTMHRPSNVDDPQALAGLLGAFAEIGKNIDIVFQLHPRTKDRIERFDLQSALEAIPDVHLIGPQGYLDIVKLQENARLALTDSAGIAEETTALRALFNAEGKYRAPGNDRTGQQSVVGCQPQRVVEAARCVGRQAQCVSSATGMGWTQRRTPCRRLAQRHQEATQLLGVPAHAALFATNDMDCNE